MGSVVKIIPRIDVDKDENDEHQQKCHLTRQSWLQMF